MLNLFLQTARAATYMYSINLRISVYMCFVFVQSD